MLSFISNVNPQINIHVFSVVELFIKFFSSVNMSHFYSAVIIFLLFDIKLFSRALITVFFYA